MSDHNQGSDPPVAPQPSERESHLRSFLKAFSWRIVATTTTTLIAYVTIGSVKTGPYHWRMGIRGQVFCVLPHTSEPGNSSPRGMVRSLYRK